MEGRALHRREDPLFYEGDLDGYLSGRLGTISARVDAIPKAQLLATPEDDVVEHVYGELELQPIVLHEDSKVMEQFETKVDVIDYRRQIRVPSIRVVVTIPYSGDPDLWNLKPNRQQSGFPRAGVREPNLDGLGNLDIVIEQPTDSPQEEIKRRLEREMESIRFYLESQKLQVDEFNGLIAQKARVLIEVRKQRLKDHEGIADLLAIPPKRRSDVPPVTAIPIKRKLIKPLPPPPDSEFKPEPGITDKDYEHILSVIRQEGRTFEATPKTYAVHDEEELRDIILAHLNGHYQGGATGETFRRVGKTDIRIEDQNRAAFVAECKVWRGAKELTSAVDQLLGYLTWRDCKAAVVIFNKHNAKFTELLSKIPETLRRHPKCRKDLGQKADGEWRYVFTSIEDDLRQIVVHVFVLNIYVAQ